MRTLIVVLLALWTSAALASSPPADLTEPRGPESDLTGPLEIITLATTQLEELELFYRQGFGLELEGPLESPPETPVRQRALWGVAEDLPWTEYRLTRPAFIDLPRIRVLRLHRPTEPVLSSWDSLQAGPFAIGFPNLDQAELDRRLRRLGFGAQGPLNSYRIQRPDGSSYGIQETIFNGPDFVKAVGITRLDGMPQLSPIESDSGLGGPAYASMVVEDMDAMLRFFTEVLDLEVRADRKTTTSGALGVPAGTEYRLAILYAKGTRYGHVLLIQYLNRAAIRPAAAPRLPRRGMVLWSFRSIELDRVLERARAAAVPIRGPETVVMPGYGQRRVAVLTAPNGFEVELLGGL